MITQPGPAPWEPTVVPNTVYNDGETRCSRPGCTTILCRYNPSRECFVHDDETRRAMLARRREQSEAQAA